MLQSILVFGLVNSAVLMLMALGFSVTFGLSKVANFSHGGIYLLAGYLTFFLLKSAGLPYFAAVAITVIITALLGALIYRLIVIRVRGIVLNEVIATLALGIGTLELFRWLGFVTYEYSLPYILRGNISIFGVSLDYQRLFIIIAALLLALFLWAFTHRTKTGLALLGMAQDEYTALCVGIDSDWTAMYSFAIGAGFAAIAAVMILPLGIISINAGYEVLIIALAVTVLGGLESTKGLILGCVILGYAQIATATLVAPLWKEVVYLAAILAVLAFRPSGLLGKFKELEERV
jgi:branched-chain amino acid transport system permease protein